MRAPTKHREHAEQDERARRHERAGISGERTALRREVHGRVEQPREVRVLTERNERGTRETNGERAGALREISRSAPDADHEARKREHEREAGARPDGLRDACAISPCARGRRERRTSAAPRMA